MMRRYCLRWHWVIQASPYDFRLITCAVSRWTVSPGAIFPAPLVHSWKPPPGPHALTASYSLGNGGLRGRRHLWDLLGRLERNHGGRFEAVGNAAFGRVPPGHHRTWRQRESRTVGRNLATKARSVRWNLPTKAGAHWSDWLEDARVAASRGVFVVVTLGRSTRMTMTMSSFNLPVVRMASSGVTVGVTTSEWWTRGGMSTFDFVVRSRRGSGAREPRS